MTNSAWLDILSVMIEIQPAFGFAELVLISNICNIVKVGMFVKEVIEVL